MIVRKNSHKGGRKRESRNRKETNSNTHTPW